MRGVQWIKAGLTSVCFLFCAMPVAAQKLAFVLGNADYAHLPSLENTLYDAAAYRDSFRDLGYAVTFHENLALEPMLAAFDSFLSQVQPGDQVAFVFAGHGWSDGQINYLIPTDAPKDGGERMLVRQSLALKNGRDGVLDELVQAKAALSLAIIDACRDNPFLPKEGVRSVGMSRGLAPIDPQQGTFVVFSAGAGQQALDRLPDDPPEQRLSVFTRTFLPHLTSGLYLEQAISRAQVETAALARQHDGHLQHPAYYDETLGDTCIAPTCGDQTATSARCDVLYDAAQTADACFAYDGYVTACPNHLFAPFAQSYLSLRCQSASTVLDGRLKDPARGSDPVEPDPKAADDSSAVQRCDALALDSWHPDALSGLTRTEGLVFRKIEPERAIPACEAAVAAFPDHVRSKVNLGRALHAGKRLEEAMPYYEAAIEKGDPLGLYLAGILYASGKEGVRRDDQMAFALFQRGADIGYAPTVNALGTLYFNGRAVQKDVQRATELFKQAAEMGFGQGQYNYALQLERDPTTRQEAAQMFFRSLKSGQDWAARRATQNWPVETAKALQLLLRDEGLYSGKIDGIMGTGGKAAMRALIPE